MLKQTTLALCGVLFATLPASANIVANGGFETEDFSGWTQINDTSFTEVTCADFGGASPPEGLCQAFFGPLDPGGGGIIQTLATVAGASYNLSFQLGNLGGPPNTFGVFWDGAFLDPIFVDLAPFPYDQGSATLVASSSATELGFIFFHQPSYWLLDAVSVTAAVVAVPAPGAMLPLAAGLALLGGLAARRRFA